MYGGHERGVRARCATAVTLRPENAVTQRRCWQLGRTTLSPAAAAAGPCSRRVRRAALARFARRLRWSTLAVQYTAGAAAAALTIRARTAAEYAARHDHRWSVAAVGRRATNAVATTHGLAREARCYDAPRAAAMDWARSSAQEAPRAAVNEDGAVTTSADRHTRPERATCAWTRGSVGHPLWSSRMYLDATLSESPCSGTCYSRRRCTARGERVVFTR